MRVSMKVSILAPRVVRGVKGRHGASQGDYERLGSMCQLSKPHGSYGVEMPQVRFSVATLLFPERGRMSDLREGVRDLRALWDATK